MLLINTGSATQNRKENVDTYEEFANYATNPIFVYKIFAYYENNRKNYNRIEKCLYQKLTNI